MRKSYYAAHVYMIVGVLSGLFYREFTKMKDFTGDSQLGLMHTHLLTLGMIAFLIVLVLDKVFQLSGTRLFTAFFWFYNAGLVISTGMMGVHGILTVLGRDEDHISEVVPLTAGFGHILLTVGLIQLFVLLGKRVNEHVRPSGTKSEQAETASM
ncbi:DUF2871 domain-containing protein [Streptomyces brevispora]|uniref:DUF2871 domain-containing protein n=1 Tax=Streptomyces brevispora TaxID=887462 RepID=A0A561UZM1_9ACTN|nr:DUF2871 domain-containing protein [Streptomyces brevispora]TWG04832.1 uncharacterized protein DUF2871 [Streptomyces brevispora]WSC14095.1 DUF2871 domain-containing protein [Streptomyces brevispora]